RCHIRMKAGTLSLAKGASRLGHRADTGTAAACQKKNQAVTVNACRIAQNFERRRGIACAGHQDGSSARDNDGAAVGSVRIQQYAAIAAQVPDMNWIGRNNDIDVLRTRFEYPCPCLVGDRLEVVPEQHPNSPSASGFTNA